MVVGQSISMAAFAKENSKMNREDAVVVAQALALSAAHTRGRQSKLKRKLKPKSKEEGEENRRS